MRAGTASPRRGMTLIELLVVIAIIAILSSFVLAAVSMVRGQRPNVETRSEFTSFEGAIAQFKQDFQVDYFPSSIVLNERQYTLTLAAHQKSVAYLNKIFPNLVSTTGAVGPGGAGVDWNGNGVQTGDVTLTGEQCLVFFLGGVQSTAGSNQVNGFSRTPGNPTAAGGKRYGPYFSFKPVRLLAGAGGYFTYQDPFPVTPSRPARSYAYFAWSAGGYQANSTAANYYADAAGANGKPINPNGYQILCAGLDGQFGSTPGTPAVWNASGTSTPAGKDDLGSFSRGQLLGAGN